MRLYLHMAYDSIKKNAEIYLPFILSSGLIVAILYIVSSLSNNPSLLNSLAGSYVTAFLTIGQFVILLFAIIFLFYTNGFAIKNRHEELGLYNVLGLEKKHIVFIVFFENLFCLILSLIIGFFFGILLDKLSFLVLSRMMGIETSLGFYFSLNTLTFVLASFGIIYLFLFVYNTFLIYRLNSLELLKESQKGEKEPRAKWVLALLGLLSLGLGYYLALDVQNAVEALVVFFPAVFAVIIGTYLVFIALVIAILKILKKNRNFYYKTNHFITLSNMMYRMKKNAVGLASICILSTMILVMASSTTSLWFSLNESMNQIYPTMYEIDSNYSSQKLDQAFSDFVDETGLELGLNYGYAHYYVSALIEDGVVNMENATMFDRINDQRIINFLKVSEFNKLAGTDYKLLENEIHAVDLNHNINTSTLTFKDHTYAIKSTTFDRPKNLPFTSNVNTNIIYIVLNDEAFDVLMTDLGHMDDVVYSICFDAQNIEDDKAFTQDLMDYLYGHTLSENSIYFDVVSKTSTSESLKWLYSGFLFLGTLLGAVFLIAIVLIVYYKQITEGLEDAKRFKIMEKVGLTKKEIKKTINFQILLVFFLPLVVSIVHLLAAYHIIELILDALVSSSIVFEYTFFISIAVFIVIYIFIYFMTSKVYYRLVTR